MGLLLLLLHSFPSSVQCRRNNNKIEVANPAPQAEILQQITDASTGTVTAMEPGKERPAVTCNEIMAKAVVTASQEKDDAVQERDIAMEETSRVLEQISGLQEELKHTQELYQKAAVNIEATKLMTERIVNEVKESTKQEIEAYKEKKQSQMDQIETDAAARIADMEQIVNQTKQHAQDDIAKIKEETQTKLDAMETEYQQKEEAFRTQTLVEIQSIQTQSKQNVTQTQTKYDELQLDMEKLQKETKDVIDQTKEDADRRIFEALEEYNRREVVTMEKAYKMQDDMDRAMETLRKDVNLEITKTHKNAEMQYERVREEAAKEIELIYKDSQNALDKKELEIVTLRDDALVEKKEMQGTIDNLTEQIKMTNITYSTLDEKLSIAQDELNYWKDIGMNPTYTNMTLMYNDASSLMNDTITEASIQLSRSLLKVKETSKQSFDKTKVTCKEFLDKAYLKVETISKEQRAKVQLLYDVHVKTTMDEKIIPFYEKHEKYLKPLLELAREKYQQYVLPQYQQHIAPRLEMLPIQINDMYQKQIKPQLQFRRNQIVDLYHKLDKERYMMQKETFVSICGFVSRQSKHLALFLKAKKEIKNMASFIPQSVITYLDSIHGDDDDDASVSYLVWMTMKSIFFLVAYMTKYHILALVWYLFKVPFRLVWFLCPLRLLFKSFSTKTKVVATKTMPVKKEQMGKENGKTMTNDSGSLASTTNGTANGSSSNGSTTVKDKLKTEYKTVS